VAKLQIRTLGWSEAPIKELFEDANASAEGLALVSIERTVYKIVRSPDHQPHWNPHQGQRQRPMDAIDLEPELKDAILKDMALCVDEERRDFYRMRGIPVHRGYLFYGPPGIGKTSLSLALACKFEKDLYIMRLSDKEWNDDKLLETLSKSFLRDSIVLIEDIDAAGIGRDEKSASGIPSNVAYYVSRGLHFALALFSRVSEHLGRALYCVET
jgi:mitochondrial chaperone BCS1